MLLRGILLLHLKGIHDEKELESKTERMGTKRGETNEDGGRKKKIDGGRTR